MDRVYCTTGECVPTRSSTLCSEAMEAGLGAALSLPAESREALANVKGQDRLEPFDHSPRRSVRTIREHHCYLYVLLFMRKFLLEGPPILAQTSGQDAAKTPCNPMESSPAPSRRSKSGKTYGKNDVQDCYFLLNASPKKERTTRIIG